MRRQRDVTSTHKDVYISALETSILLKKIDIFLDTINQTIFSARI